MQQAAVVIIFHPSLVTVTLNDMFISKSYELRGIVFIGFTRHLHADANKESTPILNKFLVSCVRSNIYVMT